MVNPDTLRTWALELPETDEAPHHEVRSFRVKKKIFATLNAPAGRATLRLPLEYQSVFASMSGGSIYPVPNKWGAYGWTNADLQTVDAEMFRDALRIAWWEVAPKNLRAAHPELDPETEF